MPLADQRFERAQQNRRAESATTLFENRPADSLGEMFPVSARGLAVSRRQVACSSARFHSGHQKAAGSSVESTNNRHRLRARRPTIRDNGQAECATGSAWM